jgi:septal ring factor EnvC (AmiA/AmiB activator)
VARRTDVEVRGLDQFRKELRQLDPALGRELGKANKRAAEVVASAARAKAMATGGVARKAAPDIKTAAAQRAAKLVLDASRNGYAIGAFTGAKRWPQFKPWQGPEIEEGKGIAVGPAIVETEDEFLNAYGDALEQLAARAFPGR